MAARRDNLADLEAFLASGGTVDPEAGTVTTVRGSHGALSHGGYLIVGLPRTKGAPQAFQYVHVLLWTAARRLQLGDTDTIDHVNGDKLDNRLTNLERVSNGENVRRAFAAGSARPGEHGPSAAWAIRMIHGTGQFTQRRVADMVGVSRRLVGHVIHRTRYADLPDPTPAEAEAILRKYGLLADSE